MHPVSGLNPVVSRENYMADRLRELLFPLVIIVIVGSIYASAMASAAEARLYEEAARSQHPFHVDRPMGWMAIHPQQAKFLDRISNP
jgi:hypothetical protein